MESDHILIFLSVALLVIFLMQMFSKKMCAKCNKKEEECVCHKKQQQPMRMMAAPSACQQAPPQPAPMAACKQAQPEPILPPKVENMEVSIIESGNKIKPKPQAKKQSNSVSGTQVKKNNEKHGLAALPQVIEHFKSKAQLETMPKPSKQMFGAMAEQFGNKDTHIQNYLNTRPDRLSDKSTRTVCKNIGQIDIFGYPIPPNRRVIQGRDSRIDTCDLSTLGGVVFSDIDRLTGTSIDQAKLPKFMK